MVEPDSDSKVTIAPNERDTPVLTLLADHDLKLICTLMLTLMRLWRFL